MRRILAMLALAGTLSAIAPICVCLPAPAAESHSCCTGQTTIGAPVAGCCIVPSDVPPSAVPAPPPAGAEWLPLASPVAVVVAGPLAHGQVIAIALAPPSILRI